MPLCPQMREDDGWVGSTRQQSRPGAGEASFPVDVGLPPGGGWEWAGDWRANLDSLGCDDEGWQYRQGTQEGGYLLLLWLVWPCPGLACTVRGCSGGPVG